MMTFPGTSEDGCTPNARVIIDGVEVPTVESNAHDVAAVETHIRKTGPAHINYTTDIHVPLTWGNEDVAGEIDAISGGDDPAVPATIELYDREQDTYGYVHHGFVRAGGGSPVEGAARVQIGDYAELFENIPITATYKDTNVQTVTKDIKQRFLDGQPILDDIEFALKLPNDGETFVETEQPNVEAITENLEQSMDAAQNLDVITVVSLGVDTAIRGIGQLFAKQRFRRDRDTLADVLNWLCRAIDARWYIAPEPTTDGTPVVVLDQRIQTRVFAGQNTSTTSNSSIPITVVYNNALYQLSPITGLRVRGHSERSIVAGGSALVPSKKYPIATATYDPLIERLNGEITPKEIRPDGITTVGGAEKKAKQALKDKLDSTTGGEMRLTPSPLTRPYSKLHVRPTCNRTAVEDIRPIELEAEEIIHSMSTTGDEGGSPGPRTVVRCGLWVDESKISIESKTESN
jgi:hypothetical protein